MSKELLENSLMCIEKGHETEPLDHNCKKCIKFPFAIGVVRLVTLDTPK